MRTKNLMMVMTALAMASCSQNEVTEVNPDTHPVIGFDVYTRVQNRGVETDLDALKKADAGFGFFAYKTDGTWTEKGSEAKPDFLYNEHGIWKNGDGESSGSWGYDNTRFWPTNETEKISFFAYAPYSGNTADGNRGITLSEQTTQGAPTLEFALTNDWKKMVDLVTDCRSDIQDRTAANTKGTVSFKFSHVLTKVANINVKPSTDLGSNIKIYVTNLELIPGNNILQDKAQYKFSNDEWENLSTPSYFPGAQNLSGFLNKKTDVNWYGYNTQSVDVSNNATPTSLFPEGEALYFIPVNNTSGTETAGDLKLKITYDIVTKVNENANVTSTTEKTVDLPAGTFKKGMAHTYTLTIQLNAISITVKDSTTDWGTPTDSEGMDVK